MNGTLQNRVLETIARHAMIRPGDRIGVGVSGGADSVSLLRLLAELRMKLGVAIFVLHFNHQLRGAEADKDERFVQELSRVLDVEFVSDRADVAGEARRNVLNLEDAARRLRYQFFTAVASSRELNRVAVAHTADDQAETVLAHLLRGTGLAGLAGIYPVAGLIIRPLLEIGREELRDYLSTLRQPWREDVTNQDTSRMRARIRHRLLPLLQHEFDASSATRLARLAGFAREEETFWRALEDERFGTLVAREATGGVSLSIEDLLSPFPLLSSLGGDGRDGELSLASTLALTRRLVRRIFADLRGSRQQLTAQHVQDVLDLAKKSHSGARIELPGVLVQRNFGRLVFTLVPASAVDKTGESGLRSRGFEYAVAPPQSSETSCIVVPEIRRRFNLKLIDWPPATRETSRATETLDFDALRWPMILRNWRPGDSYRPQGQGHTRKLKRLFLESRVPRSARASWPVITSDGHLVWAWGYPVADEFAPRRETRTGVVIAEEEI